MAGGISEERYSEINGYVIGSWNLISSCNTVPTQQRLHDKCCLIIPRSRACYSADACPLSSRLEQKPQQSDSLSQTWLCPIFIVLD